MNHVVPWTAWLLYNFSFCLFQQLTRCCNKITKSNVNSLGTKKVKNDPKIKSKSKGRIEGNKEIKSCWTIWVDLEIIRTSSQPSNKPMWAPKKTKKTLELDKFKSRIEGDIDNICCSTLWLDLKHILNHNPNPTKARFLP